MEFRAFRAILNVHSEGPFTEYTGRLTKTLVYSLVRELALFKGLKGVVQPLHISPLFSLGRKEYELGDVVTPRYLFDKDGKPRLVPVELSGEYIVHVGGESGLVETVMKRFSILKTLLMIKFKEFIVSFKLQGLKDITEIIMEKEISGNKVTLYLKAPTLLFNVFASSKLPKFSPSAVEVLMTPYLLSQMRSMDYATLVEASHILGYLVETYYSLNTLKPIFIPFRGKREIAMIGRVTYLIEDAPRIKNSILQILRLAEIAGIGESRLNGFGTVTWTSK